MDKKYLFSYRFDGRRWSVEIFARSPEEAVEKIKAVAHATYDGEIMQQIYIPINTGWVCRLAGWLKGLFGRRSV